MQPPPCAVSEYPGFGVDPEPLVQVELGGEPMGEDVDPLHLDWF